MVKKKVSLEDRVEIQELIARYAYALDTGDFEAYVDCFTPDGGIDHNPPGKCFGRDGLRKLTDFLWYRKPNHYLGRQHNMTQIIMTPDGDDVRVKAFWSILQHNVETKACFVFGMGNWDTLVTKNEDGEWRLQLVEVKIWQGDNVPWVGESRAWANPPASASAGDGAGE